MQRLFKLIVSIAIPFAAGAIGNLATMPNIPTWYAALDKPPLLPPNGVFGPVWMILYVLIGIALYLVWVAKSKQVKTAAYAAFGIQMVLNTLWSLVFFGLQLPWAGLVVIVLLLAAIGWTMYEFRQHSKAAFYLFVPYIAWVAFATYLTLGVSLLN